MVANNNTIKQTKTYQKTNNTEPIDWQKFLNFNRTTCQNIDKAKQLNTYKKNIRVLQKYHPTVFAQLAAPEPLTQNIFTTNGDWLNGEVHHNNQLHTIHLNIQEEITPALNTIQEKSHTVLCLIGAGLGLPLLILEKYRTNIQRFILVEPILEILQMALIATDLQQILADPRLIIIAGPTSINLEAINRANQQLQFEDCYIYKHEPTWHLSPAYQQQADKLYALTNELNMSGSTMIAMGQMFMANRFANLSCLVAATKLTALAGLCHNTTAILVTAGPSLDKNVQLLKKYQDVTCIISADSAFPTLTKHGITPDFITSLDPQNMVFEKLCGFLNETKQTNLICSMGVCPKIPKYFPFKQVFFSFNGSNIEGQFAALADSTVETSPSDSSPHLSLHTAITMGASTIVFIGHDLAYTNDRSHAKDTAIPTDLKAIGADKEGSNPDILWTVDIHGQRIKTTRSFLNSKAHFEQIIDKNPGRYINATEGGIGITGSTDMPLAKVLKQIHKDQNWPAHRKQFLQQKKTITSSAIVTYLKQLSAEIIAAMKQTKKLFQVLQKLNKTLPKTGIHSEGTLNKKNQHLLKQHDQLNNTIHKDRHLFNLVDELTVLGLRDANRQQTRIEQIDTNQYATRLRAILQRTRTVTTTYSTALQTMLNYCATFLEFQHQTQGQESPWNQIKAHLQVDNIAKAKALLLANQNIFHEIGGEAHFHLGCIAAKQLNPTEMHKQFSIACKTDPKFASKIAHIESKMKNEFMEEIHYALPAVKETLTLRLLQFWGNIGVSAQELIKFIKQNKAISLAHGMMAKKELILPCVAKGHYSYAQQLLQADHNTEAIQALHTALTFDTENAAIHMGLVQEYFDTGDFAKAVHHLRLAAQIDPQHAENWETIGDYLLSEGQITDARLAYENYHAALPRQRGILLKIKQCYEREGQTDAAQEIQNVYDSTTS